MSLTGTAGSELYALRQPSVDEQVGAGDETRRTTGEKDRGLGDFVWPSHTSHRIVSQALSEYLWLVSLNGPPYTLFEVDVAGRHSIDADALSCVTN